LVQLPPGRHGLPRDFVERNQRERLIVGAVEAIAEVGVEKVIVADIVRNAQVSRRTFYEHFANKEECIEAVHESGRSAVLTRSPGAANPAHLMRKLMTDSQRERLMAGTVKAVTERSFDGVRVIDIRRHAGVSARTFYEHFVGKEECIEAAYGASLASLVEREAAGRFGRPASPGQGIPPGSSDSSEADPSESTGLRGRGLPQEIVQSTQRERLIAGAAEAVAEVGYARVTVGDILRHAGVSRKAFYEHFASRDECFEAARGISLFPEEE
jgi:AcrR family transcriptional regulator